MAGFDAGLMVFALLLVGLFLVLAWVFGARGCGFSSSGGSGFDVSVAVVMGVCAGVVVGAVVLPMYLPNL